MVQHKEVEGKRAAYFDMFTGAPSKLVKPFFLRNIWSLFHHRTFGWLAMVEPWWGAHETIVPGFTVGSRVVLPCLLV